MKKIVILSLLITLPINIIGLIWHHKTLNTYFILEKFELTLAKGNKLHRIGVSEFYDLKHAISGLLGIEKKIDVALIVPHKSINRLNSNLPLSGSDYQDDSLLILNGKAIKGKAKLRGDHYYHWGFARKSWRFKTSKKSIHNGINKFNIIIPKSVDMLPNHLSYKLAQSMDLLAPNSKLVDFSVNGQYKGPRLLVEQIDESFLRKNKRMPNDIYKGDNIGQSKFIGVDVRLFENASIWEKASYNNHFNQDNLYPLQILLDEIKQNNISIADIKSFATMAAYIDLTGSYHHDKNHNWMLLYDGYYESFAPIIWDSVGWLPYTVGLDNMNIATSDLLEGIYLNFDFLREKNTALKRFFGNQGQETSFLEKLNLAVEQSQKIVKQNHYSFSLSRDLYREKDALTSIDNYKKNVIARLSKVKNYFIGLVDSGDYKYSHANNKIRLSMNSGKLVNAITIKTKEANQKPLKTILSYKSGEKINAIDISNKVSTNENFININIKLLANTHFVSSYKHTKKIAYHEATYDLELVGRNPEDIQSVSLGFDNLAQEIIEIEKVERIEQVAFDSRLQNIIPKDPITETLSWSGEKHFSGFTVVVKNIIIEKGTKIIFDEGATLKVLGKVTAIGTADEPIVFQARDSSKPWGAFALKDQRANGSVFKHVIFKDGSGDKGKLYEYTAMFSVHNVQNLLVEDSEFYDSKLTDDMVHVVYSDVKFKNSKFVRSLSDALDIDISTAVIENCEFINSGNDAIDLMTSDAIVINTKFSHSADKGISIGEGSNLLAINNLIEHSEIGMQSKDTSMAYIYNTSFIGNKKAVDAYHKNWRYSEGGTIYVDNCIMQGNIENATVGKKSKVVINNCQIDSTDNFNAKNVRKSKIIVSKGKPIDAGFEQSFFQNYQDLIKNDVKGAYE